MPVWTVCCALQACLFGLFVEARPDHVRNAQPGAGGRYGNLAMPAITVGEEGVGVGARAKGLIAAPGLLAFCV